MKLSIYTLGRVCGVAVRPACLFLANNYLRPEAATALAVAFLASSLALVLTAADPHRRFYVRQFGNEAGRAGTTFYVYVMSLILLSIAGGVVVVGVSLRSATLGAGVLAGFVYFVSERMADELLRIRLFQKDFAAWGRSTVVRSLLQLGGLGALLALAADAAPAWAILLLLAAANFVVFVPQLPRSLGRVLHVPAWRTLGWLAPRATRSLVANWRLSAVAVLGSTVGYLDRVIALILDASSLPLFMLVVMSFSVVQMAVDFYYLSRHRREFLQQRIGLRQAFASRDLLGSLGGGLLLGSVVAVAVLQFSRNGDSFPMVYVAVIAVLQTAVAITMIPQQLLYWNQDFDAIVFTELAFWAVCSAILLVVWMLQLGPAMVFWAVAACAVVRLCLYCARARRVPSIAVNETYAMSSPAV